MKVQAFMLVPIWKLDRASQAFITVSWARSSAAAASPHRVRAKARRCGIRPTRSCLNRFSDAGSIVVRSTILFAPTRFRAHRPLVVAAKDVQELIRNRLVHHVVEHLP